MHSEFLRIDGIYSRSFIPNYSAIASPLTEIIEKRLPNGVKWEVALEKAYESLKKAIVNYPILHLPNWDKTFYFKTDASMLFMSWNSIYERV